MSKAWKWATGITIVVLLATIAVLIAIVVKSKIKEHKGMRCYQCLYHNGSFPGVTADISEENCQVGKLTGNLLSQCSRTLGKHKFACGDLNITGENNGKILQATVRTCLPHQNGAENKPKTCSSGTLLSLADNGTLPEWTNTFQYYLKVLGMNETLSVRACTCTDDTCNSANSVSSVSLLQLISGSIFTISAITHGSL